MSSITRESGPATRRPSRRITRIDAVVLAACFGVLAVVAVPRQLELSRDYRRADTQSLAGSVSGAVRLANAFWLAGDQPAVMRLAGGDVAMVNGYPSAATVARALEAPEASAFSFRDGRWQHRESSTAASCGVHYRPPASFGGEPSIVIQSSGC